MKFLYSLMTILTLSLLVIGYHYINIDTKQKYEDIRQLSDTLKYISIAKQFQSKQYDEFVYE